MLGGKILLVIAAFKAHVALNFWRGRELGNGQPKAGAMGQFGRLTSLLDLPSDDELDTLIREAVALAKFPPGPRKRKHAPKPPAQMPPDFAAALDEAPSAKNVLDNFPPGSRREYLDWIGEAKQEATRAKRIATAIEWLSEGKRRNWKYENC